MGFYSYDLESNITRLDIEEKDEGELCVVIAIKPRASAFVERRIFTTEHILQLMQKRGFKIEQVLISSPGIRNYSKDENKNSGVWIFKLASEEKVSNKSRKRKDDNSNKGSETDERSE